MMLAHRRDTVDVPFTATVNDYGKRRLEKATPDPDFKLRSNAALNDNVRPRTMLGGVRTAACVVLGMPQSRN
jgi:hypothetical protein